MTLFSSLPSQAPPRGDGIHRSALFYRPGVRLVLTRVWGNPEARRPLLLGHNPSEASAERDDPTSWRMIHFGKSWGWAGYDMVNVYPWGSPDPKACRRIAAQEAERDDLCVDMLANNRAVRELAADAPFILACFGDLCHDPEALARTLGMIADVRRGQGRTVLHCLGTTKSGNPKHPMARGRSRVPENATPAVWRTI